MEHNVIKNVEKYKKSHQRKKRWQKVVTFLAAVVVFCTTYALILPAVTLENERCDIPEHVHTEECYVHVTDSAWGLPICAVENLGIHMHIADCYENGAVICGYADYMAHEHDSTCYDEDGELWCPLEEIEVHEHAEECWTSSNASCKSSSNVKKTRVSTKNISNVASDADADDYVLASDSDIDCVTASASDAEYDGPDDDYISSGASDDDSDSEQKLICEKEELFLHTHTDSCFDEKQNVICGEIEIQEHVHTEECFLYAQTYVEPDVLICTEIAEEHEHTSLCYGTWILTCKIEEHEHDLYCQIDPEADLEDESKWEKTFAAVELSGVWSKDIVEIAKTQIGYQESERNYEVMEDGVSIKGYTRYGEWYGEPYIDWNTLFVGFCMDYASIDEVPFEEDCNLWIEELEDYALYQSIEDWKPDEGQLVFFERDEGTRVGIIENVKYHTDGSTTISVIEGDRDNEVKNVNYKADVSVICGYVDVMEIQKEIIANHVHTDACYDTKLICELGSEKHEHTDECYEKVLVCKIGTEPIIEYLCGLEEHTHDDGCRDAAGNLICVLVEHTHFERCFDTNAEALCWLEEHEHSDDCYDEDGELCCDIYEHTHEAMCFESIKYLVVMIDSLPSSEEAEEILLKYEETEDWEAYEEYVTKISELAWRIYYKCEELLEEELELVTNYDELIELSWLWSIMTLEADISKITYNPEYETDDYHTQWTTPGGWITESTNDLIHINEVVPDEYTIDGLVIGAKSADSVIASFEPLWNEAPTDEEVKKATDSAWSEWSVLTGSGMDCTYGANLMLPSDTEKKNDLLGTEKNRPIYVTYKNIGSYDGHKIDLKISLVDYENYVDWNPKVTDESKKIKEGVLGFWTEDTRSSQATYGQRLPGITVCGVSWVQVLYEFFDSDTGNAVNVKGSTSFYDLDFSQAVHIRVDMSANDPKLKGIYVTNVNDSVPNLDTVNSYGTRLEQRSYFEGWATDDCVLKFSDKAPQGAGVVVYSPHGNDSGQNSEQYGDTKHAFTITFERNKINMIYSFDKGKNALNGNATEGKPAYTRNANGGIIHSGVPVYTGTLEVEKIVESASANSNEEFEFKVEFYKHNASDETELDTSLSGVFGDVTIVGGIGTFKLKNNESVKIVGIPIRAKGTPYRITELNHEGYIVEASMTRKPKNDKSETDGPHTQDFYSSSLRADDAMEQNDKVTFTNYGGPVLPHTGGTGTTPYTMAGLVLMLFSTAYFLYRFKKCRREVM